jgi:predicted DNA-binding transcriptional regulator AlpA
MLEVEADSSHTPEDPAVTVATPLPDLITAEEIAEMFGVHIVTIRRWTASGWLPQPLRLGPAGRWLRWRRETITKFLRETEGRDAP